MVEPERVEAPELPELLRRCVVEDWVSPADVPPFLTTAVNGRPPTAGYIADELRSHAWSLFRRARRAWAEQHGLQLAGGRPDFRDEPAFRRDVARAVEGRRQSA